MCWQSLPEPSAGNGDEFSKVKKPSMVHRGNMTLKKNISNTGKKLVHRFAELNMNVINRKCATISPLDDAARLRWSGI